jgi:hypothetical protein
MQKEAASTTKENANESTADLSDTFAMLE